MVDGLDEGKIMEAEMAVGIQFRRARSNVQGRVGAAMRRISQQMVNVVGLIGGTFNIQRPTSKREWAGISDPSTGMMSGCASGAMGRVTGCCRRVMRRRVGGSGGRDEKDEWGQTPSGRLPFAGAAIWGTSRTEMTNGR